MTSPDSTYSSTMGTQPAGTSRNGDGPSGDPDDNPFENGNSALLRHEMARNVVHIVGDAPAPQVGCTGRPTRPRTR